jgi:hypothetical protein
VPAELAKAADINSLQGLRSPARHCIEGCAISAQPRVKPALALLLDQQQRDGGIPTIPAHGDTVKTGAGWAFFNVNGYLGTVTESGQVITEAGFESD